MYNNLIDYLFDKAKKIKDKQKGFYFINKINDETTFVDTDVPGSEKIIGYLDLYGHKFNLYDYNNVDEKKELFNCIIDNDIVVRDVSIKCLAFSYKSSGSFEGVSNVISYKITKLDETNLREHLDVILANVFNLVNFYSDFKLADNYLDFLKDELRSRHLYVFELNYDDKDLPTNIKEKISKNIPDFIRTNLLIINERHSEKLFWYNADSPEVEKENPINELELNIFPFYNELLFFLESAQKIPYNHIKFLEYYHVLEYFATSIAIKKQDGLLKDLVHIYLEDRNYSNMNEIISTLSDSIALPLKDESLKEVLKRINYEYIANSINNNNLVKNLQHSYISVPQLFSGEMLEGSKEDRKLKIALPKDIEDLFYNNLYNRIYKIRNLIVHSNSRVKKGESRFIPDKPNLQKLESDLVLIKILSYKIIKLEGIED